MATIVSVLQKRLPNVIFKEVGRFYWSPEARTVCYSEKDLAQPEGIWALLHESAHAILGHHTYSSDLELLYMEIEAWEGAESLAKGLSITIDQDHVQDCLDTYRDWLHKRSTCPTCSIVSLQEDTHIYGCFNCGNKWRVSASRFCRPYRLSKHIVKNKTLSDVSQIAFR